MTARLLTVLVACSGSSPSPAPPANVAPTAPPSHPDVPSEVDCGKLGNGDVVVCGASYEAPSHGGEDYARDAHYIVENRGSKPAEVEVTSLAIVDADATQRVPFSLDVVMWGPAANGTKTMLEPGAKLDVRIYGAGSIAKLRYHVVYHHEAQFRVGTTDVIVRAGELYFRYPHHI